MAIIISPINPSEFPGTKTPLFQEFKPDTALCKVSGQIGAAAPDNSVVTLFFKNYIDLKEFADYSDFQLAFETTGDDFFSLIGLTQNQNIEGVSVEFELSYGRFHQLNAGEYSGTVQFYVIAQNSNTGKNEVIDSTTMNVEMGVFEMDLMITPQFGFAAHEKDSIPAWAASIDIECSGAWSLVNFPVENQRIILVNGIDEQSLGFYGDQTLELSLAAGVNELAIGYHEINLYFYQPEFVATYTLYLIVSEDGGLSVHPDSLDFFAIRGVQEAMEKQISIYSPDPIESFTAPAWCTYWVEEFGMVPGFKKIHIKPIDSVNLSAGIYQGNFQALISGETISVPITHKVYTWWNFEYDGPVHFTKDNEIIEVFSQSNEDTYVRLEGQIKVYGFDNSEKQFNRDWSLAFLNNKAEINLGREVDDYLDILADPLQVLKITNPPLLRPAYKPLSIRITGREFKYENENLVYTFVLPTQYFLRGRKPVFIGENLWLSHWPQDVARVTRKSIIALNVLKPEGLPVPIAFKRNGIFEEYINWSPENYHYQPGFMSAFFDLSKIQDLELGERLSFSFGNYSRSFVVVQEGRNSAHIGWINQFEMLELFEFTGEISMPVEYESTISETYENWVDFFKKVDKSKIQSLVVNTGWIFKNNAKIIDDLIDSNRAFLFFDLTPSFSSTSDEEGYLQLVPKAKKMVAYDSKLNLYQFEVEFTINRKHEDVIYLR